MVDLYFCFFNVFCLFIWFNTEAFIEYIKYIPFLNKLLKVKQYIEYQKSSNSLNYPLYLAVYYNNFFTKLVSCPYCLLFWVNLLSLLLLNNIMFIFINYVVSLVLYSSVILIVKKYESINNKS
jgi:hypothetical protein